MAIRTNLAQRCSRFALGLLLAAVLCGSGCDRRGEPHYLGHIAALTGPQRERGQQAMRGVQLAVEEIDADSEQWVAGRTIAVLHADGPGEPERPPAQALRLATVNHVEALIGGTSRAEALQLAPVLREHPL